MWCNDVCGAFIIKKNIMRDGWHALSIMCSTSLMWSIIMALQNLIASSSRTRGHDDVYMYRKISAQICGSRKQKENSQITESIHDKNLVFKN